MKYAGSLRVRPPRPREPDLTYLVDPDVLSQPTRAGSDPAVVDWIRANERDIVVDPIILGEMRFGINLLPGGTVNDGWSAGFQRESNGSPASPGLRRREFDGPACLPICAPRAAQCPSRTA